MTFVHNCITEASLSNLSQEYLTDQGVSVIVDISPIIRHSKALSIQRSSKVISSQVLSS